MYAGCVVGAVRDDKDVVSFVTLQFLIKGVIRMNITSIVGTATSNNSSSIFSSMLGNSSSGSSTSSVSSLSTGGSLIDYNLLKSGAYGKLMKAYYSEQSSVTSEEQEKKTKSLNVTKSASEDLAKSTSKLQKMDFDTASKDDVISALKSWSEDYNTLIESTEDVDDTSTLRQVLWMTQQTSANESLLSKAGIDVNADNTLSIDEDALKDMSDEDFNKLRGSLKTLFSGTVSYGNQVLSKASATYSAAASVVNATSTGSAYTRQGTYSSLMSGTIWDSVT